MFSKSIIGAGRFLKMPQSSRLLYYDLGMYADDDGIVEAFTIMRQTGANEDDLRVLASKGYVKILNDELVTYILDWKANNTIRPDRYHESAYKELLVQLTDDNQLTTKCQPSDNQMETEVRLGKVRLGKDRLDIESKAQKRFTPPTLEEVKAYCKERGNKVDPVQFFTYYETGNWHDGQGNPVKNWKQKLLTWEKHNTTPNKPKIGANGITLSDEHDDTLDGIL